MADTLNSLVVLHVLPDSGISGPIIRIGALAKRLEAEENILTKVLLVSRDLKAAGYLRSKHIEVFTLDVPKIPNISKPLELLYWFALLPKSLTSYYKEIRKISPDIVHINSIFRIDTALPAKILGIRTLLHLNEVSLPTRFARVAYHVANILVDKVVGASLFVSNYYSHGKIEVLYPPARESSTPGERGQRVNDDTHVTCLSNIVPNKGIDTLVRAAKIVHSKVPNIRFTIAGSDIDSQREYSVYVRALVNENGMQDYFKFLGYIGNIDQYLQHSTIHVLPSRKEACPISLLDGLQASCPVISTDVGGARECLAVNLETFPRSIVPIDDHYALAESILILVNDPALRAELGSIGKLYVQKKFSIESCIKNHAEIYRRLTVNNEKS